MKKYCLLLLFYISFNVLLSQEINWKSDTSFTVELKDSKSILISNLDSSHNFVKIAGVNRVFTCLNGNSLQLVKLTNLNDTSVKISICDTHYNAKIFAKKATIVSAYSKELIIEISELSAPEVNTSSENKYNLYYDAYNLIYGDALIQRSISEKYNLKALKDSNNYIKIINDHLIALNKPSLYSGISKNSNLSSSISSILGLDVTTLADGLAKFLVSRVKKEMAIALFDDLSRRIRSDSTKDIQVLFKNTYGILDLLGDRIYDFHPYISSLRQNMEYDFQNIPESLQSLLEENQSHLYKLLNEQKNLLYLTGNTLDLAIQIKKNNHLGKTIAAQDFKRFSENADTTLIGSLQTLQEFSEALRDTFTSDTMPYWLDKSKINKLVNDTDLLICFMGLFVEVVKKKDINIRPNLNLYNYLNDSIGPEGVGRFDNFIKSLQNSISQIQQIHPKFRNASTEDDKKLQVVNYFDAAHSLIKTSEDLVKLFTKKIPGDLKTFYSMAENINGVIKYAVTKKYTLSAMHLAKIMESFDRSDKAVFKTISFIVDKSLIIGQIAEARTADEVKEVIESFAAPVGSWRDKRMAKFNLALDSYVGPGYIQSISKENSAIKDISNFTVSTPIGLSASFMLYKGKTPFTILTSLLDIGPITAKRFSDDTATIGKIYLKEILAPGIHGSISFNKKFPITFNVGYQQFPLLKKIGEVDLYHKSGISASINVNIPILTIKNDKINSTYLE